MRGERTSGAQAGETAGSEVSLFETVSVLWTSLDRGWQAVCLSFVLVVGTVLGLPIPW